MCDSPKDTSGMSSLSLLAPAKINLFLHITGRRNDGYHNLQTLFQLLDYGDQLDFTVRNDGNININCDLKGLAADNNLVIKAAKALKAASGCKLGVDIVLHKKLPLGGGIGGGSSDAATTLVGLNHLWKTKLTVDELAAMGAQLGADVPVFIRAKTAWAEGIGDRLQAIESPPKWFVVLAPNCHISTAEIFSHKDLKRDSPPITAPHFLKWGGRNDCQELVRTLYPEVDETITWLNQFGSAQMTGTGACVFATFDTEETASAVLAKRPDTMQGFVAKGINQSPIYNLLS